MLVTPAISQTRGLIGAEQAPVCIGLDAFHEEVSGPQAVEEVACTSLNNKQMVLSAIQLCRAPVNEPETFLIHASKLLLSISSADNRMDDCKPHLFFAMVLSEIQPVKNVCMPWFKVYSKGTLSLATTLVHISAK